MDDVISLVTITYAPDLVGNQIATKTTREVFCRVQSVGRNEFYSAAQLELHPEYIFVLSNYADYLGEKEIQYKDWTGQEKTYDVIRTFRPKDSDRIEITAQERVANYVAEEN